MALLEAGSVLNQRYRIRRPLGEGGMGLVFLVEDLLNQGQPLALKTLRKGIFADKAVEHLKEEFRAMTRLRHPNLARVYDFGWVEGTREPFLTLEYLEGPDLSKLSREEAQPKLPELIVQLSRALDYIHTRGVLHNDIKPQNIFLLPRPGMDLASSFQAKLMDFGLARLQEQNDQGNLRGTIHYTAPEVFRGRGVDARADLYSLGVVLFRLATGSLPFPGKDPASVIREHCEARPPAPRSLNSSVPAAIERLILWLLEKNPEDRPERATVLIRALNEMTGASYALQTAETRESYVTGAILVGREREMEILRSALRSLKEERTTPDIPPSRLVFIGGESGAGKSRLLREFRYQVQTEGLPFLTGSCYESGSSVYQPFVESLRLLASEARAVLEERKSAGDEASEASVLAPLFPDLFPAPKGSEAPPGGNQTGKKHLFAAATRILREVGNRGPFVLALEDLHWADPLSLEFLSHLQKEAPPLSFLLIGTYRDDEAAKSPLHALLTQAVGRDGSTVLKLGRLESEEITRLIQSMLSLEEDPQEFSLMLQRQTAGNPLFIEEVLKTLAEESTLDHAGGRWKVDSAQLDHLELPRSINEVLNRRLSRLSDDQRQIARMLAVFNRPISQETLARTGGWSETEIATPVAHLSSRGLLMQIEEMGEERVGFAHAKTRELIYRGLGPERKQLHLRAGEILEAEADREERIEELAYHFLQAGAKSKGLHYAERAGDKCFRLYAYPSALEFFQKAIMLLPRKDSERRLEVLSKVARIHSQSGNYAEMQDYWNRALRLARARGDRSREGHIIASIAHGHLLQGHFDLTVRNARTALGIFEPLGDELGMGRAKNFIATAYARMSQFDDAIPYFVQAVEHLEAAGDLEQTVAVRTNLGIIHVFRNRVEEGLQIFREALDTWNKLGDKRGVAMTQGNIALALKDLGDLDGALVANQEACRLYRETFDRTNLAHNLLSAAEIHLARGAFDRAAAEAGGSLEVRREIGEDLSIPYSLDVMGTARRLSGDTCGARELHQEGLRIAREHRNDLQEGFLLAGLALDAVEEEQPNEASMAAEKALVIGRRLRNRKIQILALRALVAASLAAGHAREAASRARVLQSLSAQEGNLEERFRAGWALGSCHLAEMNLEKAEEELSAARTGAERIGRADLTAEACLALARVAAKAGRKSEEADLTRRAAEAFRDIASRIKDSATRRRYLATGPRPSVLHRVETVEGARDDRATLRLGSGKVPPVRLLTTLYEIGQIISTIRDQTVLLNRVLDLAIQIVGAERGLIFLRDESSGELHLEVARNLEQETVRDAGEYSRRILQESQEGRSIISLDAGTDHRFESFDSVSLYNIRSLICVPLRLHDRILGTVYLDTRKQGTVFGNEDLQFLEAFATQAAIAIENARLYESLREENLYLKKTVKERYGFENIIGKSPALEKVLQRLARVADSDLPVIIQGESGTGKELVARAIHFNSPRREKRFLSENVAALPETLLESELFGHVRGAFTGAEQDKAGLFELAHDGTLFLDEVGDMSPSLQSKLLRVLQDGEIRPVGGSKSRKVNVRIVAATNKDLKRLVAERKFREDLFYRLNVVGVTLPPLRQRKEDLPLLIDHFLASLSQEKGGRPRRVDPAVLELLARYEWPGNIRELENTISRLALFATGPTITLSDLARDPDLLDRVADLQGTRRSREPELRKKDLKQALKATRGNRMQAAALLGISRATLFRKLKQFQIKG